jgi:hypothetical protein
LFQKVLYYPEGFPNMVTNKGNTESSAVVQPGDTIHAIDDSASSYRICEAALDKLDCKLSQSENLTAAMGWLEANHENVDGLFIDYHLLDGELGSDILVFIYVKRREYAAKGKVFLPKLRYIVLMSAKGASVMRESALKHVKDVWIYCIAKAGGAHTGTSSSYDALKKVIAGEVEGEISYSVQ